MSNKRDTITTSPQPVETSDAVQSVDNPLMTLVDAAASLFDHSHPPSSTECRRTNDHTEVSVSEDDEEGNKSKLGDPYEGMNVIPGRIDDLYSSRPIKVTFPEQLMCVLDDKSNEDVIAWMPDGKSFAIVNHKKFTLERMFKLFKVRNLSSFVRKLTRWGFQRVLHEKETHNMDIFNHRHFQRGNRTLCKRVKCMGQHAPRTVPVVPAVSPAMENAPTVVSQVRPKGNNRPVFVGIGGESNHHHQHHRLPSPTAPRTHLASPRPITFARTSSHTAVSVQSRSAPVAAPHMFVTPEVAPIPRRVTMDGPAPLSPTQHLTSRVVSAALETLRRDNLTGLVPPLPSHFADIGSNPNNIVARNKTSFPQAASTRALLHRQESQYAYDPVQLASDRRSFSPTLRHHCSSRAVPGTPTPHADLLNYQFRGNVGLPNSSSPTSSHWASGAGGSIHFSRNRW